MSVIISRMGFRVSNNWYVNRVCIVISRSHASDNSRLSSHTIAHQLNAHYSFSVQRSVGALNERKILTNRDALEIGQESRERDKNCT